MINEFKSQYHFLSNFSPSPIKYKGKTYPTAEHLFQALKTKNKKKRANIRRATSPNLAKRMGRSVSLRDDWEQVKDNLMYMVIRLKFSQNPTQEKALLRTKNQKLVEGNWWHDNYWGDCCCPHCNNIEGYNQLGKTLMKVRTLLNS
jgi:hypothetical protein